MGMVNSALSALPEQKMFDKLRKLSSGALGTVGKAKKEEREMGLFCHRAFASTDKSIHLRAAAKVAPLSNSVCGAFLAPWQLP